MSAAGDAWLGATAAVIGGVVTGVFALVAVWRTNRAAHRSAQQDRRASAYANLLTATLVLIRNAGTAVVLLEVESGVKSSLLLRQWRRSGVIELVDFHGRYLNEVIGAASQVLAFGSPEAVQLANKLVVQGYELTGVTSVPGTKRGKLATLLLGIKWSDSERAAIEVAIAEFSAAHLHFANFVRLETGLDTVDLPLPGRASLVR
jgi:hypothetical protein